MLHLRRKAPTGEDVSPEFARGMACAEGWYRDFVIWAWAYISLLEKRLAEQKGGEKNG